MNIEVFSRYFGYRGIFKVFWISRYFQCILDIEVFSWYFRYFQGIYKVFSSMRVRTRLCQRLAVAQSTLTSLIEQRPTTFRAPHRPRRPRQPRSRYASQNTKYNTNTYYTKYSRVPEVLCNPERSRVLRAVASVPDLFTSLTMPTHVG